ncbi:redoxin domain-containing protein [uncultured Tenacibaculum sp.]|uniref:peroxiredoxin family protein n=1 Tax=uncultured Tenacibaculum sp. TaxID=174713 RepID=UPI0026329D33|nr:redoxin domain-containing protein [uncultured Tenacibaculum sp.]
MKKKIRLVLGITLFTIVTLLGYKIVNKLIHKKEVTERTKVLPSFSFSNLKGKIFTRNNLRNIPTVFIYFNSDCDYCQSEAIKIKQRLNEFENIQLVFISFESKKEIEQFAKRYELNNKENIVFLEDKKAEFSELFDVHSIPYVIVYDSNHKLLKKFKGVTKIDNILKVLK